MAFKSFAQYQEDKNGEFFVLTNDGDSADVVFLYRSIEDVLVADVHYINTPTWKGYVHCCGAGCPACTHGERGLRIDHKLFIPLYNIQKNKIEFWDRSTFFESVLQKDVFASFPNPSETVFKITRRGAAGSRDTKYEIRPVARNTGMPYETILASFHTSLPEAYSAICKEMTPIELGQALNATASATNLQDYGYTPIPRSTVATTPVEATPAEPYNSLPSVDISAYAGTDPNASDIPAPAPVPTETFDYSAFPEGQEATDDSTDTLDNVSF